MEGEPTAAQRENAALVQRAFQLYVGRDVEGVLELYDPDVEVIAEDFLDEGPFHGHSGFMEWSSQWNAKYDFDLQRVTPVGARHVAAELVVSEPRGPQAGRERPAGWVAEVRQRLIVHHELVALPEYAFDIARRRERLGA
jgi:hypothetical protein